MAWGSSGTAGTARLGKGLESMFSFSLVSSGYTSVEYSVMLGREERGVGEGTVSDGRCGETLQVGTEIFPEIDGERMTGWL